MTRSTPGLVPPDATYEASAAGIERLSWLTRIRNCDAASRKTASSSRSSSRAAWSIPFFRAHLQHRQEGLLRDLHAAHPLHPLLAFLLLLQQFALTADVTAVALGEHILAHGRDRFAGNDLVADGGLQRHFEHLPRDQLAHALDQQLATLVGHVLVYDHG